MKLFILSFCSLLIFYFSTENKNKAEFHGLATAVDHSQWNLLLKKYVDDQGDVNYKAFKKDEKALDAYLKTLAENELSETSSKSEKLAYFINLYNAATIKLILKNYPIKSIKDIKKPWDQEWIKVGAKIYSLGDIEHKILRKMNEPRIHFAINCASYSCPKLSNKAFMSATLETQLQNASIDFINDPKRNIISADAIEISMIFKWFKSDFTENGSVASYLQSFSKTKFNEDVKISFITYDWRLNETE